MIVYKFLEKNYLMTVISCLAYNGIGFGNTRFCCIDSKG